MAVPGTPASFNVQQGNGQVFLSWNLTAGATSYSVQQSLDGVTFSSLATPASNSYLDTAVTVGTNYYYQVAATNGSGTGSYTSAQSIVPTYSGQMTLGQVRLMSQQRADRVNSQFVTMPEWNSYINQSYFELYDILTNVYDDYFVAEPLSFTTDGSTSRYPLPNGSNYDGARPFYKLIGVDCGLNAGDNAYISLDKFNFIDRNRFIFPNVTSTYYGVWNMQYRLMGDAIMFIPTPSGNQTIRMWYQPRMEQLLKDTDILDGVSGWSEYVVVDAAIKALEKEESDTQALMLQKQALLQRIEASSINRDTGAPQTISDTRANGRWGHGSGPNGGGGMGGW